MLIPHRKIIMIDGYAAFLIKFKEIYPETYLKVIEFPDAMVIGWINEIRQDKDMITMQAPEKVKQYFEMKMHISGIILRTKI